MKLNYHAYTEEAKFTYHLALSNQIIDNTFLNALIVGPDSGFNCCVQITTIEQGKDTVKNLVTVLQELTTLAIPNLITPDGEWSIAGWDYGNFKVLRTSELDRFKQCVQFFLKSSPKNNHEEDSFIGNPLPADTYFYYLNLNYPLYTDPLLKVL